MGVVRRGYLVALVLIFIVVALHPCGETGKDNAVLVSTERGVPNGVAAIYLHNRLYDTAFEVVVFAVAVLGSLHFLGGGRPPQSYVVSSDPVVGVVFKGAAYFALLFGCILALGGHLEPGGGFAAGVAVGTSLVAQSLIGMQNRLTVRLQTPAADSAERLSWAAILLIALATCGGIAPPAGAYGTLLSGGWIPLLNILIALKVGLGTWGLTMAFLEHRWIF
ncbi:MAG: hypothetical protein K9L28_01925 [Synergistales bacterium]|nr:hypothetical protein [Synergistales bacterium]